METPDPRRLLLRAAMLLLAGSLVSMTYRLASPAKCDPLVQLVSFSPPSAYDTATECRAYSHGKLLVMEKSVHRRTWPFAVAASLVMWLLMMPAMGLLIKLYGEKSPLNPAGLSVLVLALAVWIASVVTGIRMMKTEELPSGGNTETHVTTG